MRALATTDAHVDFWRSHTKQGFMLCYVVGLVIVLDVVLSSDQPHAVALCAIAAFIVAVALAVPFVPLERVVRHPCGRLFLDAWDGAGIVLVRVLLRWARQRLRLLPLHPAGPRHDGLPAHRHDHRGRGSAHQP